MHARLKYPHMQLFIPIFRFSAPKVVLLRVDDGLRVLTVPTPGECGPLDGHARLQLVRPVAPSFHPWGDPFFFF